MALSRTQVDRTLRALTAQLQAFLEPLQAKVNNTKASSMPSIRNLEGNRLVVHVSSTLQCLAA